MATFVLSPLVVAKIVMHACKYPHAAVNGVLLADRSVTPSAESAPAPISITDAVPLFHTNLNLAPMLEAALMQVESTCKDSVIVGYYQANELMTEVTPDGVGSQIYHKIADNCPLARCLYILVDNNQIDRDCETAPLTYYQRKEGTGQKLDPLPASAVTIDSEAACLAKLSALLHRHAYRALVDFDNHLDNIALDWTNARLADDIAG